MGNQATHTLFQEAPQSFCVILRLNNGKAHWLLGIAHFFWLLTQLLQPLESFVLLGHKPDILTNPRII